MEAILDNRGNLLVVAESEFERSYVKTLAGKEFRARVKTGASQADIVGLKLEESDISSEAADLLFEALEWHENTNEALSDDLVAKINAWREKNIRPKAEEG